MRATESAKLENARNFSRLFNESKYNIIFRMKRSTNSSPIAAKTQGSVDESPLDPARKAHYPAIGAL
jgi:hypothetical protein